MLDSVKKWKKVTSIMRLVILKQKYICAKIPKYNIRKERRKKGKEKEKGNSFSRDHHITQCCSHL